MPFLLCAKSTENSLSEMRQTEASALGLALEDIDRGYSAVEVRNSETDKHTYEKFLLAYLAARGAPSRKP